MGEIKMAGIGTLVNGAAVIIGGLIGILCKRGLSQRFQDIIMQANGLAVIFIGITGALEKMITVSGNSISTEGTIMATICLTVGAILGEAIDIDEKFERFGAWLKARAGRQKDSKFIDGFITTTLIVCVGAMGIVGSIEDALSHDPSMLFTKALLDGIIVVVLAAGFGVGAIFSVIPLLIFQGTLTLFAGAVEPFMTEMMINNISMIGSMLVFCVGANLFLNAKIKVANLLPALLTVIVYTILV